MINKYGFLAYLKFGLFLMGWNAFSQTKNNTLNNSSKKVSDTLIVVNNNKETKPLAAEIKQDTANKIILKTKIYNERFRCTQPDPKTIAAKKAGEEKFKKNKTNKKIKI